VPCDRRHDGGERFQIYNRFQAFSQKRTRTQVHLVSDVDRDGQHLGGGGGIDGSARRVGQVVIKKKKASGLAARCMFGNAGSGGGSSNSADAVCIRTCKPHTVSVWSAGDFSLRDCPLSLMVIRDCTLEVSNAQNPF
jgi:hypothetical protein